MGGKEKAMTRGGNNGIDIIQEREGERQGKRESF
jgi:hypothetical protein